MDIGFDAKNGRATCSATCRPKALVYARGATTSARRSTALLARFRALPETQGRVRPDRPGARASLGGSDAVFGWWGDTALRRRARRGRHDRRRPGDPSPTTRPRPSACSRPCGRLRGPRRRQRRHHQRDEDHDGTKITILDLSGVPGRRRRPAGRLQGRDRLRPSNDDVVVIGYGSAFVERRPRRRARARRSPTTRGSRRLLGRVGAENIGLTFVDIAGIRGLVEPLVEAAAAGRQVGPLRSRRSSRTCAVRRRHRGIRKDGDVDRSRTVDRRTDASSPPSRAPTGRPSGRGAPGGSRPRWQSESG